PTATPDPEAAWAEAAAAFREWLPAQPGFENFSFAVKEGFPYLICVNRTASCVTVYADDGAGSYSAPYMAMVCSGGEDTPVGSFSTPVNYDWRLLSGPCYGQYATRSDGPYLSPSLPYT